MDLSTPLELDVQLEPGDYLRANYMYGLRNIRVKALLVLAVLGVLAFIYFWVRFPYTQPSYEMLVPMIALGIGYGVLYFHCQSSFKSRAFLREKVHYRFTNDGVDVTAETFANSTTWAQIPQAFDLKDDFLIFHAPGRMYTIPKRFFRAPSDIDALRALLRDRLGKRLK